MSDEQQKYAKHVNYGALYGIRPPSLAVNTFADYDLDLTWSRPEPRSPRFFFGAFPTLAAGLKANARECQRRRYVEAGPGRVVLAEWQIKTNGDLLS